MKKSPSRWSRAVDIVIWLAVLVALFLAFMPRSSGPQEGKPAPTIGELPLVGNAGRGTNIGTKPETFSIPGKLERPLLIYAFASWCGACRQSNGILEDLKAARQTEKLDVVAVSLDSDPRKALAAKINWPINVDVLHDQTGAFSTSYEVEVLPTYILIGTDGTVKRVTAGIAGASDVRAWLKEAGE